MKIAIDVDNCISNTQEYDFALAWQFNRRKYPEDKKLYFPNHNDADGMFDWNKELFFEFYSRQRQAIIKQELIFPKPYVGEVLNNLLKAGHEIIILTLRGDSNWGDAKKETEKWLKKYQIGFSECVANCREKGNFCKENNVDLLIEDTSGNAKKANDLGIQSMLILADYNKDYQHELNTFASCWPEVYEKLSGELLPICDV